MDKLISLETSDKNEILVYDESTDRTCKYFYRSIGAEDRKKYRSRIVNEYVPNQDPDIVFDIQVNSVLNVLTGFEDSLYSADGENPISSDKESEHYYPQWKELIRERKSDHLVCMAVTLFGAASFVVKKNSASKAN